MTPSRDDDLDWLYGRDRSSSQPEPTRVLPPPPQERSGAPQPAPTQPQPVVSAPGYPPPRATRPIQPAPVAGGPGPPGGPGGPTDPYGRGGPGNDQPHARRRPARTAIKVIGIVLALFLLWLIAVPAYAWSRIPRVDDQPPGDRPANQPGTTFLLVGSDSREGLSKEERKRLGTGNSAGQRTDTIMILSIPSSGKPALISIPRDSYLPIPGHGSNKINAAYAFGGPELLVQTVEHNTGLKIDAYTEIGFGGFVAVIDALGGIEMCLPKAIKDKDSHLDLPKGCQVLNGTDALGYVRMRKADPLGDLGRVQRQRQMLGAVAKEAASPLTVLNPVRYWRLGTAGADSLKIGQDTSFGEMVSMGLAMRKVSTGAGLTVTVPIATSSASTSAGSAVLWDTEKAKDMFADMARGDTSDLEKYAE